MKISCPSCEAKYSIGDDKVQSRLAKIRCRKCGVDIVIDGRVQPPTISVGDATSAAPAAQTDTAVAASASASGSSSYTVDFGENDQRNMSLEEVVAAYNSGHITSDTFLWADGMGDWTPLSQVTEVVDALNAAAGSSDESASAPASDVASAPKASAPRAAATTAKAAARTQGRGGADLFSAISTAGSEEDVARQAAFEPMSQQATTGARNESSVLFSLSALTASAKPSSPASSLSSATSAASKEDSGLIDLKALTSQATENAVPGNAVALSAPAPLGAFGGGIASIGAPLGGLGAPLGGGMNAGMPALSPLGDIAYPAPKKNRMGLFILGGAGILAVAIVAGLALQPKEQAPVVVPKPESAPLVAPKPAEPEPIKPAVSEAKPPPTGEAAASASAPAKVAGAAPKWRAPAAAAKKPNGGATGDKPTKSGSDSAPAPKKPATSKCGCAAGDLGCAMRCAAKGG